MSSSHFFGSDWMDDFLSLKMICGTSVNFQVKIAIILVSDWSLFIIHRFYWYITLITVIVLLISLNPVKIQVPGYVFWGQAQIINNGVE